MTQWSGCPGFHNEQFGVFIVRWLEDVEIMDTLSFGETMICKWKDNIVAAYSVGGDDSLRSQLCFAIPEMDRRGIHGTW